MIRLSSILFLLLLMNSASFSGVVRKNTPRVLVKKVQVPCVDRMDYTVSPFYAFWDKSGNRFGLELNEWFSYAPNVRNCGPVIGVSERINTDGNDVMLSPALNISGTLENIMIIGFSLGPELKYDGDQFDYGASVRTWWGPIGFECFYFVKQELDWALYFFIPFNLKWLEI